jgi:hypothetical protein
MLKRSRHLSISVFVYSSSFPETESDNALSAIVAFGRPTDSGSFHFLDIFLAVYNLSVNVVLQMTLVEHVVAYVFDHFAREFARVGLHVPIDVQICSGYYEALLKNCNYSPDVEVYGGVIIGVQRVAVGLC